MYFSSKNNKKKKNMYIYWTYICGLHLLPEFVMDGGIWLDV